jgi:hypothetical protein
MNPITELALVAESERQAIERTAAPVAAIEDVKAAIIAQKSYYEWLPASERRKISCVDAMDYALELIAKAQSGYYRTNSKEKS